MKILWLTHAPIGSHSWVGSRHFHLLKHLRDIHEIHLVSWKKTLNPLRAARLGTIEVSANANVTIYSIQLGPNIPGFSRLDYPRPIQLTMNQFFFRKAIEQLYRQVRPELLLYSSSHHFTGFPYFPSDCPIVFDYLDLAASYVEPTYLKNSSAVIAASPGLLARSLSKGKPAQFIPNGICHDRYRTLDRLRSKKELGLEEFFVVSLIGLTCSPSFYFVDAIASLQEQIKDLCFLIVGDGRHKRDIEERVTNCGIKHFRSQGHVSHTEVAKYFMASDIGIYPGDDIPYFRLACPIKILEYTAAGAQVVTSHVDMFEKGWPNIRTAGSNAVDFGSSLREAHQSPLKAPKVDRYDWGLLAREFNQVLLEAYSKKRAA